MGQGGKIGHYPVHFHMARQVPAQHLHQGFVDRRIDDPLDRAAFDPGRAAPAQHRLQIHRPRLLSSRAAPRPTTSSIPTSASSPARRSTIPRIRARCPASSPTRRPQFSLNNGNPLNTYSPDPFPLRPTSSIPRCSGSATAGTSSSAIWRQGPVPAARPIGSSPRWNSDMPDVPIPGSSRKQVRREMKWRGLPPATRRASRAAEQHGQCRHRRRSRFSTAITRPRR